MILNRIIKIFNQTAKVKSEKQIYNVGDILIVPTKSLLLDKKLLGSKPSREKMKKYLDYFKANGKVDKPIDVYINGNGRFVVIDKYIRFLILENNAVENAEIRIVNTYKYINQ